ncbi:hypothetical protein CARUB_v10022006mg [Capsella rubella]|uniref:Bet v I/Major latex protein domain-containing protein n=1 Tax=Capsella rubella TaxID=81985 RepID=R0GFP0_9BRAS|nr:hypothetical protein CARUB_v10022006mg [Capsella rubella]
MSLKHLQAKFSVVSYTKATGEKLALLSSGIMFTVSQFYILSFHIDFRVIPRNIFGADGEAKVAKERIEAVEPEKNLITFRVIEGDLLKEYKSFVITIQVTPKQGGRGSVVHWHVEYEKIDDKVAHPETFLEFCVHVSKEIDEHLLNEE